MSLSRRSRLPSCRSIALLLLALSLCFALGCGGSGGSQSISPPQNPVPSIRTLTPNSAIVGSSALAVTVTGSGFIAASAIYWNDALLTTSYVSSTSLTAQVPASDLGAVGTANISVQNPGPGGGTSSNITFTVGNPVPSVTAVTPNSVAVDSASLTITVSGSGFVAPSVIQWNNAALSTTFVSSTSLTAQVPSSELASEGAANVAVQNPAPGGGTSSTVTFSIKSAAATYLNVLNVEGTDLAWDPSQKKLYIAVPSTATTNPTTVTVVDPIGGSIGLSQPLSSSPSGLAISDDSQYLYTVINGGATIQRLTLPSLALDIQFDLGTDADSGKPNLAGDIKVQPGSPHTLAISFGEFGSTSVGVYDDAVERSSTQGALGSEVGNSLQWSPDGTQMYAAWGFGSDSPYSPAASDQALYTMPVNTNGVGTVTTYHRSFRSEGVHVHSDPATGYVYDDWGEVLNAKTGTPEGNYKWNRPSGVISNGPLSVLDPNLKLFYTLMEVYTSSGYAFQIQQFDQTQFQLLRTIIVPNANGIPVNFIRWGQSGLAVVTSTYSSSQQGQLYLLDGGFVNPSGAPDTTVGTPLTPVPTLTAINPITATTGSDAITLTVNGRDFTGQPTVFWNGVQLVTTLISGAQVSAQIPASDLASVNRATITVSNGAPPSEPSNSLPFSVNAPSLSGNQVSVYSTGGDDLVWDANAAKIYVSMPGVQGDSGGTIAIVDPVASTVTNTPFLGSDPDRLSLSSDGQYLYVGLDGQNAIQQLDLPGFTANTTWNLGGVASFDGPYYALDVQASPGAPQTSAVILANFDLSPSSAAVVIYDGSVPRSNELQVGGYNFESLQWATSGASIYAADQYSPQDFLVLGVSASGVVLDQHYDRLFNSYSNRIHYDPSTGMIYNEQGQVVDPSNGTVIGDFGASGIAVPDSTLNTVFILGQTAAQVGTTSYTIDSFNQTTFAPITSMVVDNVVGIPTAFIRWGTNGLAFTTLDGYSQFFRGTGPGQLYVVSGNFVQSAAAAEKVHQTKPLLRVHKTWGRRNNSGRRQSPPLIIHRNSMMQ